jgi:hypothetical protein
MNSSWLTNYLSQLNCERMGKRSLSSFNDVFTVGL